MKNSMSEKTWSEDEVFDFAQYHLELAPTYCIGQIRNMMRDYKKEHTPVSVVEKDYEILLFQDTYNKGEYFKRYYDNTFVNGIQHTYYKEDELLKRSLPIHSVKRLSDGEVFTVGDDSNFGKIIGFTVSEEFIHVQYGTGYVGWKFLNSVKKVSPKKILGTTLDGKVCYKGDDFPLWRVLSTFELLEIERGVSFWFPQAIYFADKGKADEYVLANKPITVSYKDLAEVFSKHKRWPDYNLFKDIKEFFKSKINQP